jgi:hypothetical protein
LILENARDLLGENVLRDHRVGGRPFFGALRGRSCHGPLGKVK